jgi:hypothetical protein
MHWVKVSAGTVAVMILLAGASGTGWAEGDVLLFGDGVPRCYLDVSEERAETLGVVATTADFERCFGLMTGTPLPRVGRPAQFPAGDSRPLRFEMRVTALQDASPQSDANATVGLVVSPTRAFVSGPLAEAGEKVTWTADWDRGPVGPGTLTFRLTVANQAYYGPGYGPFICTEARIPAPDLKTGGRLALALELRGGPQAKLRGGPQARLRGAFRTADEWQWTEWVDPAQAGVDTREPGVSDRNGPQAWGADWAERWARTGATLHIFGYAAKGRQAEIGIDDVAVTQDGKNLWANDFSTVGGADGSIPGWTLAPRQGTAVVGNGQALLRPDSSAWNTVGLRALSAVGAVPAGLLPLRLEVRPYPAGVSRYDARTVQGFEIEAAAAGGGVTVRAFTRLGLENGLTYMLDRWGCRWVMPGPLGECLPQRDRLSWPVGIAAFAPRGDTCVEPTSPASEQGQWYRRNLSGYQTWMSGQHYWLYAIPAEQHFATHPEWYSLIGGKRLPLQLCTSNPEVVAAMIAAARQYLAGGSERMSFPMDPMDCIDFCQCAACRALDPPGVGPEGAPLATDRVLAFVNAVADGIRVDFPDRYVAFYAYATHHALPTRERPRPNVAIGICRDNHCLLHLTPTPACPSSDFHSLVRAWRAMTSSVWCYEYDPISWTGGLPCPTFLEMARSLRVLLADSGVRGSYCDGGALRPESNPGTFLNIYLARRMKVDPTQDPDALLTETCRVFYGPAATAMERYWRELARVSEYGHPGRRRQSVGTTYYHELFTPAQMVAAREAMAEAQRLARGQEPYATRVGMVATTRRYLEAYLDGVWSAQRGDYAGAVAGFERMDGVIGELVQAGILDEGDSRSRAKTMRLKALANAFPEKLGFVTTWRLLGPFDNAGRDADLVADPFEAEALAGREVRLADGTRRQWWDYVSPGGFVNLEQAMASRPRAGPLSACYAATTVRSAVAAPARLLLDSFCPFNVYLNGVEVFHRPGLDSDCPDKRVVDVELQPGDNRVVVKLSQTVDARDAFPWGLYFRVDASDQRPEAAALPALWAFRADPQNAGVEQGWFRAEWTDAEWLRIPVGKTWEQTAAGAYDGYAWYRARFVLPAEQTGKALSLVFGAVDEQAWVYLNGQLLGEHTVAATGKPADQLWEEPFEIQVPAQALRAGAENVLAVRVHDSAFAGGIYRRVRLVSGPR